MKKKIMAICSIAAAVAIVGFLGWTYAQGAQKSPAIPTVSLAKTDLVDSILASGTIASSNSKKVYAKTANYLVASVPAATGDRVKAGDVLAILDTASLEADIRQTELNIRNAEASLDNDASTNVSSVKTAENNAKASAIELETAQDNYDHALELSKAGEVTPDDLKQKLATLERAKLTYDNARLNLKNGRSKSTTVSMNNIEIQKITLEKQMKTLSDAKITAPIDGTVTLANAKAGESASGLLFIVEDTDHLIVKTAIGEYDISLIKPGQLVTIKTDSTGDIEFPGTVAKIAPAAMRDASGSISAANVQFETEVSMQDTDENVRIGLNVRLTVKLAEKRNVYAVPYDAISEDENGEKWINVIETSMQGGKAVEAIRKIKVSTGMETDMSVEIQATELTDGMRIATGTSAFDNANAGNANAGNANAGNANADNSDASNPDASNSTVKDSEAGNSEAAGMEK